MVSISALLGVTTKDYVWKGVIWMAPVKSKWAYKTQNLIIRKGNYLNKNEVMMGGRFNGTGNLKKRREKNEFGNVSFFGNDNIPIVAIINPLMIIFALLYMSMKRIHIIRSINIAYTVSVPP